VKISRLRCHRFRSSEVRLWLSVVAYDLGNLWRRLVLPRRIGNWSLTSLQQRLVKTGGRLLKHARYYWLLLAESHLTRRLFGATVQRMAGSHHPNRVGLPVVARQSRNRSQERPQRARCLKNPVPEAARTDLRDFWMGSSEPIMPIEERTVFRWMQTKVYFPRAKAKKLIPDEG
jgi:hypothetical protein